MDKEALEIRTEQWRQIVEEANRSDLKKRAWCKMHGIPERQFYYWQCKFRKRALAEMEAQRSTTEEMCCTDRTPSFFELKAPATHSESSLIEEPDAVWNDSNQKTFRAPELMLRYGIFQMLIPKAVNEETLRTVIKVIRNA